MRRLTIIGSCLGFLLTTLAGAAPLTLNLEGPDAEALIQADKARDDIGPERFAWPYDLNMTPADGDGWDLLPDGSHRWQLDVRSPGSLSLCFGFDRFRLPWGAELRIVGERGPERLYTAADVHDHGQLWTPVVLGDEASVILTLPAGHRDDHELRLVHVGRGYRFFGEPMADKQGTCNIDVVCPESAGWETEIRSVGVYQLNGTWKCTGALINNTAEDGRPFFLTADHCDVTSGNASTVVVYWNFESPVCGMLSGGELTDTQSGAIWRAAFPYPAGNDMCLLELVEEPDAAWEVTYAGWDRSSTAAPNAVAIHHPSTDEKAISFENDALQSTSYLQSTPNPSGTHWRVIDWDLGTTEPGSSGSPLFNASHRIIGALHGGYAACNNDASDWYGRFDVSWAGGGTSSSRVSDWLDPLGTNTLALDSYDPADTEPEPEPTSMAVTGNPIMRGQASEISFTLERTERVQVKVYDLRGRHVATAVAGVFPAGVNSAFWDGGNLPAGVYLLRRTTQGGNDSVAVTVLR